MFGLTYSPSTQERAVQGQKQSKPEALCLTEFQAQLEVSPSGKFSSPQGKNRKGIRLPIKEVQ